MKASAGRIPYCQHGTVRAAWSYYKKPSAGVQLVGNQDASVVFTLKIVGSFEVRSKDGSCCVPCIPRYVLAEFGVKGLVVFARLVCASNMHAFIALWKQAKGYFATSFSHNNRLLRASLFCMCVCACETNAFFFTAAIKAQRLFVDPPQHPFRVSFLSLRLWLRGQRVSFQHFGFAAELRRSHLQLQPAIYLTSTRRIQRSEKLADFGSAHRVLQVAGCAVCAHECACLHVWQNLKKDKHDKCTFRHL